MKQPKKRRKGEDVEKSVFKGQLDLDRFIIIRKLDEWCFTEKTAEKKS